MNINQILDAKAPGADVSFKIAKLNPANTHAMTECGKILSLTNLRNARDQQTAKVSDDGVITDLKYGTFVKDDVTFIRLKAEEKRTITF